MNLLKDKEARLDVLHLDRVQDSIQRLVDRLDAKVSNHEDRLKALEERIALLGDEVYDKYQSLEDELSSMQDKHAG